MKEKIIRLVKYFYNKYKTYKLKREDKKIDNMIGMLNKANMRAMQQLTSLENADATLTVVEKRVQTKTNELQQMEDNGRAEIIKYFKENFNKNLIFDKNTKIKNNKDAWFYIGDKFPVYLLKGKDF